MKTVYVLFRDAENYGHHDAVGWFVTETAAAEAAEKMEWDEYRKESQTPGQRSRLLSPDETEYRRFNVQALNRLD